MRSFEEVARKGTAFAAPELARRVVATGLCAYGKALSNIFADGPGAFAETPIGIVFVWTAGHHCLGWGGSRVRCRRGDRAHAASGENANGDGCGALGRGGG